jgi:hypothetical protein
VRLYFAILRFSPRTAHQSQPSVLAGGADMGIQWYRDTRLAPYFAHMPAHRRNSKGSPAKLAKRMTGRVVLLRAKREIRGRCGRWSMSTFRVMTKTQEYAYVNIYRVLMKRYPHAQPDKTFAEIADAAELAEITREAEAMAETSLKSMIEASKSLVSSPESAQEGVGNPIGVLRVN